MLALDPLTGGQDDAVIAGPTFRANNIGFPHAPEYAPGITSDGTRVQQLLQQQRLKPLGSKFFENSAAHTPMRPKGHIRRITPTPERFFPHFDADNCGKRASGLLRVGYLPRHSRRVFGGVRSNRQVRSGPCRVTGSPISGASPGANGSLG
jgi:hypothetical protein